MNLERTVLSGMYSHHAPAFVFDRSNFDIIEINYKMLESTSQPLSSCYNFRRGLLENDDEFQSAGFLPLFLFVK